MLSGKFAVLAQMLDILWNRTRDKIVIVSNYTQTLDLITTLCRAKDYPFVRLDGSTTINKRQKLVGSFACLIKLCAHLFVIAMHIKQCLALLGRVLSPKAMAIHKWNTLLLDLIYGLRTLLIST
jgi:hypothetical protein